MASRALSRLHRDDPEKQPLVGHVKATRQDWLNTARDVLVSDGVAEVKILSLSARMQVSRSSFYGYFKNRTDLLDALQGEWEVRNTAQIVAQCTLRSGNITEAVCNFFRCFVDPLRFDHGLDFAVREWARRDDTLRQRVDAADGKRLDAVTEMFSDHGYVAEDAGARARILYFMQLGYHALEVRETVDARLSRVRAYLLGFTGRPPDERALRAFISFVRSLDLS